jgi:hypothetical protein
LPERVLIVRDAPLSGTALPNANRQQIAAMNWAMAHGVTMHGQKAAKRSLAAGALRSMPMNGMSMHGAMGHAMEAELHGATNAAVRNPYVPIDRNYRRFIRPSAASDGQCGTTPQAAVKALMLNGQTQPSIGLRPGEQQFWRVVNAGADTYLDLQVDNTTMTAVALDGVPLGSGVNTPRVHGGLALRAAAGKPGRVHCYRPGRRNDGVSADELLRFGLRRTADARRDSSDDQPERFNHGSSPVAARPAFLTEGAHRALSFGRAFADARGEQHAHDLL